jgi:hypothetical protein
MASTESDAARERARSLYLEKLRSWEPSEETLVLIAKSEERDRQRTASRTGAQDLKRQRARV